MTNEKRISLLEKVRKLMALGTSPNEHEAAAAAAKAQEMLDTYNLSVSDLDSLKEEADNKVSDESVMEQDSFASWELYMFMKLADCYDLYPLQTHRKFGKDQIRVVGFAADIEVFNYIFPYLLRMVHKAMPPWFIAERKRLREVGFWSRQMANNIKTSFCRGMADRLAKRIKDAREERLQANVACRDLIIVKGKQVQKYVEGMELKTERRVRVGSSEHAYNHGAKAGDKVAIHHAIKSNVTTKNNQIA